jgi:hypothetical protein
VSFDRPWKKPQVQRARAISVDNFGEHRRGVVVADDEIVAGMGIKRYPSMPKVCVDQSGLVLLVVVHPQLHGGLASSHLLIVA